MPANSCQPAAGGLPSRPWLLSYKTSSTTVDGRPVDILHDFYIPALQLAVRYDRVAGYFRSSSLAAASQGFSSFVGRQGKMRLIVGADLEPADVRAILAGDRERLAARLNQELDGPATWPTSVQNGVGLLAWMVAHGHLEVRVAFRVHRETGEPLPFDAVGDGYVHEKWFLLHDEQGHSLYGSGTLNESRTALVLNAENIDIHCSWWGETDRRRVEQAAHDFENLWAGRVPHVPVLTLPEAVRRRLIRLAENLAQPVEIDGSSAAIRAVPLPAALERLRFALLRDGPRLPGGRLVGLETAPVEPWPHQTVIVQRLVETWPYSYLLCDEVGLGKTIEAGLAFRSLYLAGLARRILIAAPAGLTPQWHRQMASRLLLSFGLARTVPETGHEYIFPHPEIRPADAIFTPDLVIVSTGLLARRERLPALERARPFDIALVDEAHALRRRNPNGGLNAHPDYGNLYLAVRDYLRPNSRCLWLATATPMQLHPVEVADLLALTNRAGAFQFDPTLTSQYYEILGKLVNRLEIGNTEWDFLQRSLLAVQAQDPLLWTYIEECVIDARIRLSLTRWLNSGRIPRSRERELMLRLLFSAAPLSRLMLRHTRRLLEIYREKGQLQQNLARRHILPVPEITFTPQEQRVYDQLEDYCRELAEKLHIHGDSKSRQMVSFLLSFMRLRFASSLYAFRNTLQNRLHKVEATLQQEQHVAANSEQAGTALIEEQFLEQVFEDEEEGDLPATADVLKNRTPADLVWERNKLRTMLRELADLSGPSSKMRELLRVLDGRRDRQSGRIKQTVIFTRFYDTLTDIVQRLLRVDPQMLLGTYSGRGATYCDPDSGQMVQVSREEVKERFLRGQIDVLICTDAAAEGLNLQTADLLINFDLGWNPMKVEQRIGRIDRIGQKHRDIYILNLCYLKSAEQLVYGRLLSRLAEASLIVGTQQVSLLPVQTEEFQQLAEGTLTFDELEARVRERLALQQQQAARMEMNPGELYEIYARRAEKSSRSAPVNLSSIWEALSTSPYLQALGCEVCRDTARPRMVIRGVSGIADGTLITADRHLYDEGLADESTRLHFASYGDPVFDQLLEHYRQFALPPCVRRIAVPLPGVEGAEMVGYAVACQSTTSSVEIRLITSWQDMKDIQLAKDVEPDEAAIAPLREQLNRRAQEEMKPLLTASYIEQLNLRAARAQLLINCLAAHGLLEQRAGRTAAQTYYKTAFREVEELYQDRERVLLPDLPAQQLQPVQQDLLFECHIPGTGNRAQLYVSRILARCAVDTTDRLVESMKERKSKMNAARVMARLQREIASLHRQLYR